MKKLIIPVVLALVGTSFVTYSFLDTFVIPKNVHVVSHSNVDIPINFGGTSSSSIISSSSSPISSSNDMISSSPIASSSEEPVIVNRYYEDKTPEEIAALFTETKVFVEREHYSDSDIYIDITTHRDNDDTTTYYVADIRIKNLGYFKTAFANDTFALRNPPTERTSDICKRHKGILAINGDTYGSQEAGYVIRNGDLDPKNVRTSKNLSRKKDEDLVIKKDGTFEIIDENYTSYNEVVAMDPWHVFSFGPALVVNGEINVTPKDEVGTALAGNRNQRCAIGIISPGHYCFVVSDGRNNTSSGLSLYTLGTIMKELHCETVYNLDGGGSATMYLDDGTGNANKLGHLINVPGQLSNDPTVKQREVSDIVYIGKES